MVARSHLTCPKTGMLRAVFCTARLTGFDDFWPIAGGLLWGVGRRKRTFEEWKANGGYRRRFQLSSEFVCCLKA